MGKPDRNDAAPSQEAKIKFDLDFDTHRLSSLCDAISESCKQAKLDLDAYQFSHSSSDHPDASPNHGSRSSHEALPLAEALSFPALDRPERSFVSASAEHAKDIESPRLVRPLQPVQTEAPAPTSVATQRNRRHWLAWILPSSVVAAGIATACWFGFVEWPLLRSPAPQPDHVDAEVRSSFSRGRTLQLNDATGLPDDGQMAVRDQTGLVNEPIPTGISLRSGSGHEIVILDGLVEGTQLSLGTSLSPTRWSLPAKDLDKAFIGAPKDFSGTMTVTAKLYSSSNDLLHTKFIRLEWVARQIQNLSASEASRSVDGALPPASTDLASSIQASDAVRLAAAAGALRPPQRESPPVTIADRGRPLKGARRAASAEPVLSPSEIGPTPARTAEAMKQPRPEADVDVLLKLGKRLLHEGDIAAARVSLRRAAEAGSAEATFDLGMSFDPSFLKPIGAGAASDPVQAAEWYARATKLGQKDAGRALERLAKQSH